MIRKTTIRAGRGAFPNRLKVCRVLIGITQYDLAIKARLSPDRYWYLEHGYKEPTDRERARLAKVLKVAEAELGYSAVAQAAPKRRRKEAAA